MNLTKKAKMIIISVVVAFVMIVGIIAMILLVPLKGKENTYTWSKTDDFNELVMSKNSPVITLNKKVDENFKILVLTDMQLWTKANDNKEAFGLASRLIDKENPNLVVLTGDNVSSVTAPYLLKDLIEFFEKKGVEKDFYWAPVFGNHDNEVKATPNWSADQYEKASIHNGGRCLFSKGPNNLGGTVGNYVINIKEEGEIIQSLYMMDNSQYIDYPQDMKDYFGRGNKEKYITHQQISWFEWNASNVNKISNKIVPSMVFTHFAQYEALEAFNSMIAGEDKIMATADDMQKDFSGKYKVPNGMGFGAYSYAPGVPLINTGFIDKAKALGLHLALFGHDHENDAVIEYEGVTYGYGLKAGPSPRPWNDATEFGGTTIVFNSKNANKPIITHVVDKQASDYWGNK